ncbi:MAG TPA: DUF2971 domain-containing protein [Candidatus Omnitrophota bacterium]|nr:DUF2971 domain-containing protein [Candidatus Omnitrophota bacterium]
MKLYKYKSLSNLGHVYDILLNKRLYCASIDKLNDPFEGMFSLRYLTGIKREKSPAGSLVRGEYESSSSSDPKAEKINTLVKNKRICCLSEKNDDVLLWAHYADSCAGIAIEIEVPDDDVLMVKTPPGRERHRIPKDTKRRIFQVDYKEDLPEIIHGPKSKIANEQSLIALTTKLAHWKYEKEFRVIQKKEHYHLDCGIKKVYCGCNIDAGIFDQMKNLFGKRINLIRMNVNHRKEWITF